MIHVFEFSYCEVSERLRERNKLSKVTETVITVEQDKGINAKRTVSSFGLSAQNATRQQMFTLPDYEGTHTAGICHPDKAKSYLSKSSSV